ncbi:MAG: PQQ-binding-like beta-propeller repeat protein, partial [Actinomycetota bacterium]
TRVFRYWTGDDSDATTVIDEDGFLYVGVEVDRNNRRAKEVGQLLKIDPRIVADGADPVVWRVDVNKGVDSGTWSTPALWNNLVIWPTKPGTVYAVDRATGAIVWTIKVSGPALSSPLVVDDTLILGDGAGKLRAWSLAGGQPNQLWEVGLSANIESSPVMWNGRIYVGSRSGFFYAVGDE